MDTKSRFPSATALGKRKWLPQSSSEHSPVRETQAQSLEKNGSEISNLDGDLLNKKPRLTGIAATGLAAEISEDVPMRDVWSLTHLPHEILQHIFSFVDPISLGRLMCVNRSFHILLDPAKSLPQPSSQVKQLSMHHQDYIWTISRRSFLPGFPKPLDGMTELDMWRLIRGRSCQFCGKKSMMKSSVSDTSPWNGGPGPNGVRTIWPFRVRSCGTCLETKLVKAGHSDHCKSRNGY